MFMKNTFTVNLHRYLNYSYVCNYSFYITNKMKIYIFRNKSYSMKPTNVVFGINTKMTFAYLYHSPHLTQTRKDESSRICALKYEKKTILKQK